jgi:hypothetical protein
MTPNSAYPPEPASRGNRRGALQAAEWLSLSAAPTFAFMATLTAVLGGGAHEMLCSAASRTLAPNGPPNGALSGALNGMIPMYVLMSAVHFAPWLKLISRGRGGARAAGFPREGGMARPSGEQRRGHVA